VLLNLLLRNYLHYNLVEQAQTLASKTTFPENASNNQFCRYLFSMGRIQAIQLEYSEAYLRLTTAARKAPQDDSAKGFAITVHKLTVIVQLLMGEIPERSSFNTSPLVALALKPYLFLTKAVRAGNLQEFSNVVAEYQETFKADKNYSLIQRLSHNVLKTGLRKISVSYSRIALTDVAEKLQLPSVQSAEYICARAIKDGVIEASIDHENGWLSSNEIIDVYSTEEPQKAFHRRIVFCLDVHNEAVKSMRYPPDAYKKQLASSKTDKGKDDKEDEKTIDELIKEMEEEEDEL
jgi:26S proteasome regulatory subunit N3